MRKLLIFAVLAGLFAYFVWPTQYQEFAAGDGPYVDQLGEVVYRVDRISGEVFVKQGTTWKKAVVRRPELLRPDITGPTSSPRVDQGVVQQQKRTVDQMQSTADAAADAARDAAGKK